MTQENCISQSRYAEIRGVSPAAVTKALAEGRIFLNADGLIDVAQANSDWQANTRARVGKTASAGAGSLNEQIIESRALREAAEARISQMKADEMEGLYLRRDDVENMFFSAARQLRDGLANCTARLAADVANLNSIPECEAAIDKDMRQLLSDFHAQFKAIAAAGEAK